MSRQPNSATASLPIPGWDGSPIRPTVATVDLGALAHNYRQIKDWAGTDLLAVVKADAYGHGAVACARVLEREGAAFLGVAMTEEGLELRGAGIGGRILVLGGAYGDRYDLLVGTDLTPVVFRREHLEGLAAAARTLGRPAVAHVKVDTGMGRLGVLPGDFSAFLDAAETLGVELEGFSTHFANADLPVSDLTGLQLQRAAGAFDSMVARGRRPRFHHLANSAATLALREAHGNLIRSGTMLYGCMPADHLEGRLSLRPVLRWSTAITHLKVVEAGTPISYGSRWTATRRSTIATLPVGYADGYPRVLTNVGQVLVGGQRAPVTGTVCMDLLMVDVTDLPDVKVGDEAVLLGPQGSAEIRAEELARLCGTIHYEVFCGIGPRVPRRFV